MKDLARRINFFTASFMAVLGISLIGEIIMENDFEDKIDDFLMLLLGFGAIYWYKKTGHKLDKSIGSIVILLTGIIIKIAGIYIEHADKEAVGDDFGILAALLVALIFVFWQTYIRRSDSN